VWSAGKYQKIVQARSLLCYRAVRELGESMAAMSRRLGLSITAVSQTVLRGELLVKQSNLLLVENGSLNVENFPRPRPQSRSRE